MEAIKTCINELSIKIFNKTIDNMSKGISKYQ